ncbi:hypothetical protein SARC_03935 [Sphaeroforma arctica JP610]|uniref:Uncharacterized protein n=1 Tax=Sphaeroforma arctica JP610 TaxID=667725 RepID=A0A0L0G6H0_9EUKA|nr:hypothetical protein SARC_03935 [Sphaeroforma arctica JP610]KNC83828.1 hypothetical protein SARC_03935 [Sphaeroforma arctica JP610]|eukprot:XP_014157730.1 hypothetical protein SARC_03935 [Sphaeroforma arctica JP610]
MRGGFTKLFLDYVNVIRMMVMQAAILVVSLCMFHFEKYGRAFYRFNASMILVWQLVFEMLGDLVWNEVARACGLGGILINENMLISPVYDLIDPRGRLDLLMQDEELYSILLAIARRRYMDENFRFMKDVRQLQKTLETQYNMPTSKQKSKGNDDISSRTLGVLDNCIITAVHCPVNLPSKIIGPLRARRKQVAEQSVLMSQVESEMHTLLLAAYSEIALLIHSSQILRFFSRDVEVCAILKGRLDRLNTLCGTVARFIAPPHEDL